jgi:hypothetical protein
VETVVVGLEVSPERVEPLRWAGHYCRSSDAEVVGVVAYRPDESELPQEWYEERVVGVFRFDRRSGRLTWRLVRGTACARRLNSRECPGPSGR